MAIKKIDKVDQHAVALLAANGGSINKISKQTGLHHSTIKKVLAEPSVQATKAELEEALAESFSDVARRALENISDEKLEKASPRDLGVLAGICIDKNRLITGQSTQNIAVMMANAVIAAAEEEADA